MKKWIMCIIVMSLGLYGFSQDIHPDTEKFIKTALTKFSYGIDRVYSKDADYQTSPKTMNDLYGGDYFNYNGQSYGSLKKWLEHYGNTASKEGFKIKDAELKHTFEIDELSYRKVSTDKDDHRYTVKVTLKRETTVKNNTGRHDYKLVDRNVTITIVAHNNKRPTILGIDGNWDFNPVYPTLRARPHLAINSENQITLSHNREEIDIPFESYYIIDKYYGEKGELGIVEDIERIPLSIKSSLTGIDGTQINKSITIINDNRFKIAVPYNYSRKKKKYTLKISQYDLDDDFKQTTDKVIKQEKIIIQQDKNPHLSLMDFEPEELPDMTLNLHYGTKQTIGFSLNFRPNKNKPFTIGLLLAPSTTRWKHLADELSAMSIESSLTILTKTEEVDGYQVKMTWSDFDRPGKRDYSAEWDPDSTAIYKRALSYGFIMPGIYVFEWMRVDIGLGFLRKQDTYLKKNIADKYTVEYTPLSSNAPPKENETVYVPSMDDFLFKDKANWQFSMRYGLQFEIPLSRYNRLNIGTGYSFTEGVDLDNWDFNVGVSTYF